VAEVSYTSQQWPQTQYNGHAASQTMMWLGDPTSGPLVSLSVTTPDAEDAWTRTHSHGSDQFRVIMRGSSRAVGRHVLRPGQFAFQESGMVYREGIGGRDDDVWSFLVAGDRRGASTVTFRGDNGNPKYDVPKEMLEVFEAAAAANPGGVKGIPGVVTTLGSCRQGYLGGSFADAGRDGDGWRALAPGVTAAAAAWGDRECGPVALLVHAAPGSAALPRLTTGTESVFLVVGGSCMVGEAELSGGDLRVTAPDLALNPVMAGDDGLDALLFVADRRALPAVDGDAVWQDAIDTLLRDVVPVAQVV
ncbi:MAG TPA: hypothetical protein VFP09_04930, partial [Desertimonas sp.]|nr:hypothetical protein [Desertimonas sp.]